VTVDVYDDTPEGAPALPKGRAQVKSAELRAIRSSHKYQKLRADFRFLEEHRWVNGKEGAPCWLCGGDIDYRLSYPHPYSWSLDHAVAVKHDPSKILDTNNFRSSHHDCNQERGSDDPKLDIGVPSEIWAILLVAGFALVNFAYAFNPAAAVLGKG